MGILNDIGQSVQRGGSPGKAMPLPVIAPSAENYRDGQGKLVADAAGSAGVAGIGGGAAEGTEAVVVGGAAAGRAAAVTGFFFFATGFFTAGAMGAGCSST
jgi:hypothetical protein